MSLSSSGRVVINTLILYIKMLITIGISLYSTRLILISLGTIDYGIFSLIGGIIIMLSFLNTAMTTSTQRYLSFYQGKNDYLMQRKVFFNSLVLHIFLALIIIILLELSFLFIFDNVLNIPLNRIISAKYLYHFMSLTVLLSVISVPFVATLNAHENMLWIAIVSIIESILKLLIAFSLSLFNENDRLQTYGFLLMLLGLIIFLIYAVYCIKKYKECVFDIKYINKNCIKELTSFAGWNLFGALCSLGRTQGIAVLLNIFFGTRLNATYGIANQIAGNMSFFSVTLLRALNPQIMKSEGCDDRKRMLRLSMIASKFGFFLLAFIAIPSIFEMSGILKIWLKDIPIYSVYFCSLMLIGLLINQLTIGLQSAIQATGKIKIYQALVGSILLLNLPISYFFFKMNFSVYSVLIIYIIIELIACALRLLLLNKIAGLSLIEYFNKVFLKEFFPTLTLLIVCYIITNYITFSVIRIFLTFILSICVFVISIYFTGLCSDEKLLIDRILVKIYSRSRR